jgi:hypothetical protein
MKETLLSIVNKVLSSISGDEINSIGDTIEALQVADLVQAEYEDMISVGNWEHLRTLAQLDASGDNTKPTHMQVPEDVSEVEWIKYDQTVLSDNGRPKVNTIPYLYPDQFLNMTNGRDPAEANVDSIVDFGGTNILVRNDIPPSFWTSFDDEWAVFDSYDSDVDTTLQSAKTQCLYFISTAFSLTDSFIPVLPSEEFPRLVNRCKMAAWRDIKQQTNRRLTARGRKQDTWSTNKRWKLQGGFRFDGYGRNPGKERNWKFDKNG